MSYSGPSYGSLADHYDDWFAPPAASTDATVRMIHRLARQTSEGPILELGVGTGRVALPLAACGHEVHGIDASPAMIERLRAKPGGVELTVTTGDFVAVPVAQTFAVVYVANGTFFELTSQADQLGCFASVARRLRPGGLFVLDAHLPEALVRNTAVGNETVTSPSGDVVLRSRRMQPATQRYVSDYLVLDEGLFRHVRISFRYAAPGELDLMAAAAGLRLCERFGGWSGEPLQDTSSYHVSVYELPR